jgi:hypothetical protein
MAFDPMVQRVALQFPGKYRIKHCDNFQYEIDKEAIDYHITFCTKTYTQLPENVWKAIFHNNNDNKKNWPSLFRKKQKTNKEKEILKKLVGRWRLDNAFSSFHGFLSRSLQEFMGYWKCHTMHASFSHLNFARI